ncbi:MAG: 3-hydroxyacyl-[acyl-carrier-protein] dehydratase FabZ [Gammaproteobacteria bacterium]|nr:MAG: 3-hydroxyacyl-[acyl-carrier-protein] dehydratase FabZ [Gammaproteobacteria bacterium TMED257]CAI8310391.1 MAG: 3-hydroxyacyl-[acyl-carrier-protein] dehydratase FabZ [Gammaproteobacteria bacterium]|tara:strand:- start:900 stop:1337 length:438 start_codon:yes stop_codon:yes gene_type:complete
MTNDIQNYLPHRYPFLLIDKLIKFKKHEFLIAQKNVSNNEPFFQGHFPEHPVFPGVLILEAMAQATALLDFKSNEREKNNLLYYFVGIDKARFKKPVLPGDILIIEVNLIQSKRDVHKFNATCKVDDVVVCTAELLGAVREKNDT